MSRLVLHGRTGIGFQGALRQSGHHRGSRHPSGDQGFCMIVSMLAGDHAFLLKTRLAFGERCPNPRPMTIWSGYSSKQNARRYRP